MIETSTEIKELIAALKAFQGSVGGVKRDSKNPHFKSSYASLEAVIDTARPALQEHDLAFTQAPGAIVDGAVEITTMLMHTSGQWLRSTLHVPLGKRDAQGVGSSITYGCRYSLMATLGLPPTDDDGEGAIAPEGTKDGPEPIITSGGSAERMSAYKARKDDRWTPLVEAIRRAPSEESLKAWMDENEQAIRELPVGWIPELRKEYSSRLYAIRKGL